MASNNAIIDHLRRTIRMTGKNKSMPEVKFKDNVDTLLVDLENQDKIQTADDIERLKRFDENLRYRNIEARNKFVNEKDRHL